MSEQKYFSELHNDHTSWLSELSLAKDELKSYEMRLQEVNAANTATEVRAKVEHFQNQFIRQHEVIDTLMHYIHAHESSISAELAENTTAADHRKSDDHVESNEDMTSFRKIFDELKSEFLAFVSSSL